jgi:RNA recognition motif-containing protein
LKPAIEVFYRIVFPRGKRQGRKAAQKNKQQRRAVPAGTTNMDIYVGNLAYATTDEELNALFAEYGTVSAARVVKDRVTGRSKGFGFVEMPDTAQANAAIAAINGREVGGRTLRVNESQPRTDRPPRGNRPPRRSNDSSGSRW